MRNMFGRKLTRLIFLPFLVSVLPSCQRESTNITKTFLSYRYMLEDCADVHGQDIYSKIWFSEYNGTSYKQLFDLDFEKSFLDMRVVIKDDQTAEGQGLLSVVYKDSGEALFNTAFTYYCLMTDTTGGYVVSDLSSEFGRFVYCIYWCRLNVDFVVPSTGEQITLTLHFRGGEGNPAPKEFGRGLL